MRYRNILFCFFILSFLLIFSTVSSASDDLNQTTTSQLSSSFENDGDTLENQNIKNSEKISKNIILNSNSFDDYVTDGKFNDEVSDGDTIDIQGKLDSPRFALNVNKAVNIISSTDDAYIDFHTISTDSFGGYRNGIFQVTKQGTGTNITGITFHNTRVSIENTSDVYINNISLINEHAKIGGGVGAMTIREGSENITVTNSYFKTWDNTGHSNVVFAAAYNCLFENNTVDGYSTGSGDVIGNLFYLTTYNVKYASPCTNINITIRNNIIRSKNINSAICYGLCLEGKGHLIENNYIDTVYPVMAQYADSSYGMETDIDEIIFKNNVIVGGNPQLVFPGTVINNTFGEKATLNQVKAYNNTFNNVTIKNYCVFENNTAQNLKIEGNNNTLINNEVYSNEDYAVTVNGENNTLTDNKFAGYLGRGENAIYNSTEIVSINNSENISRVFYFDDDNLVKYFDISRTQYIFKKNMFKSNDILIFNRQNKTQITFIDRRNNAIPKDYNLTIINCQDSFAVTLDKLIAINCSLLDNLDGSVKEQLSCGTTSENLILINSTVGQIFHQPTESINSTWYYINKDIICPDNTYIFFKTLDGFTNGGMLVDSVTTSSNVLIYRLLKVSSLTGDLYVNKELNISAIPTYGFIDYDIHFDAGSAGTNVNGITFNGKVYVNDNNIKFMNCTFNQGLELNNTVYSVFDGNIINNSVNINSSNNLMFTNNVVNSEEVPVNIVNSRLLTIENNNITTNADKTINFDEASTGSIVKDNVLISNSFVGDETVVAYDNDVEDNTPPYNTSIIINSEELMFKDDTQTVNISVINLYNDTPVTKGYVEVYFDGILQCIKPLTDGQISVDISANKSSLGEKPIKVWYYDGIKYADKVSSNNVDIEKSNVNIIVDEFTAKLNEKTNTNITFLNQKENPVQDTNITVTVATTTYTLGTLNGIAILDEIVTKEWFDSGRMTITFPDTDMYNRNITTVTLNTSKADVLVTPEVTVDGSTANIKLTYTDDLQQNVTDGKVTVTTIDGTQLASGRVNNGVYTATVTIPDNYESEYLVANYTGSFYYNDLARNVKLSLMLNSTITLETNDPVYGEELVITGKLEDSKGNTIGDANVTVNINGNKVFVSTDSKGEYTYTYTPSLGLNTITATFNGNDDVYGTSITKEITIRDTDHDMNDVLNQLDEITKANEQLQEQLALQNEILAQLMNIISDLQQQNNNLSDKLDQQAQANDELSQQLNDTTNALTQQNNELKEQLQETTNNLTGQIDELNDKVNNLTQANSDLAQQLNDTTNNLTDQNNELKEQLNNLTQANDEISQLLENTTNALTEQNNNLKDQLANQSQQIAELEGKISQLEEILENLTASEQTTISISPVVDAQFNDEVTITGVLSTTKGNSLSNQVVTVSVNGNSVNVTTVNGVFEYRTVVKNIGDNNNITVSYDGSDKYNPSSANTTFTVDKADCIITIDDVTTVKYGENVTITGTFTNGAGKAIANSKVKLQLNGVYAYVKTDKNGVFTWTTAANRAGENTIVASYGGSAYYNSYKTNATFNVEKQDLMITADDVSYSDGALTIKGTFKNVLGTAVKNTNVRISLNGKIYYAKTDENGTFLFTQAIVANKITYVLGYGGSATYNAYTGTKTTLTVA